MKSTVATILVFCLVGAVYSQSAQQFQADITIRNDPNIQGSMTGVIDYDYTGGKQAIRFNVGGGVVQELILFQSKLRYLICGGTCEAETWQEAQPIFFKQNGDTSIAAISVGGRSCNGWSRTTGVIRQVWIDDQNRICRAQVPGGRTYDFSVPRALDSTKFAVPSNCPQQQCGKLIDFVLVLDESGSIDARSFTYLKDFSRNLANAYSFGPLNAAMGIVMFSSAARVVLNINSDKTSVINAINSIQQQGGYTCLGCGISRGHQMFNDFTRAGAQKVMIFMTDGQNNRQTSTFTQVRDAAKAAGIIIFAIAVAQADESECRGIASNIPGVTTYFYTPTYDQLGPILDHLIIVTCVDIPGNPCGSGCKGFCSCGKTCLCPSTCDDSNLCTNDLCSADRNGAGCYTEAKVCNDNNACTTDKCNPNSGCYTEPLVCSTTDQCKIASCDVSIGCQFRDKNCDDNNPCTADSCLSASGCSYADKPCDRCRNPVPVVCPPIPCKVNQCDTGTGNCIATDQNCDDGLVCSVDGCTAVNATTGQCTYTPRNCDDGNACTTDFCSEVADISQGIVVGCNNKPINVTQFCDDQNVCTNDYCNTTVGCVNEPIICDDNQTCTTDTCNSLLGCQFTARDCRSELKTTLQGDCYVATCTEERACFIQPFEGRTIDKCGVCDGDNSCITINPGTAAGIAAGVLAAIIIGSIVVCAVLGAIGGKKGYDIYMRNKNNMTGANTNPLYHDNGLSGTNPMYTDEDSRL